MILDSIFIHGNQKSKDTQQCSKNFKSCLCVCQQSCKKVMFSVICVCLSIGSLYKALAQIPLHRALALTRTLTQAPTLPFVQGPGILLLFLQSPTLAPSLCTGPWDMFKPVHYEAWTVGKQLVDIDGNTLILEK